MDLYQETNFYTMYSESNDHIIAAARLTNDVVILIRDNGTALGTDGHVWAHVSRRIGPDEYEELGWTPDRNAPITLQPTEPLTV